MKLATYKDGSRDGQLVVVSRDLSMAHHAQGVAGRLQQVLDDWNFLSPQLEALSQNLNHGKARHAFAFDPARCMAPLPRAYQWLDGSAYPSHLQRLRRARGAAAEAGSDVPLMYQGSGDDFLGARDDIVCADPAHGLDFEGEIAVVTGDVPMGTTAEAALESVRLVVLVNDLSLRHLIPFEVERGLGLVHGKPATAFAPVAVTPDELGSAWQGGRLHLQLDCEWNGHRMGRCETGPEMAFHFGQLLAHACKTRNLRAGTIVGGGTVSNADAGAGHACLAERRAVETIDTGQPRTEYMRSGDRIRIEVLGLDGRSVFGAIDQRVSGAR